MNPTKNTRMRLFAPLAYGFLAAGALSAEPVRYGPLDLWLGMPVEDIRGVNFIKYGAEMDSITPEQLGGLDKACAINFRLLPCDKAASLVEQGKVKQSSVQSAATAIKLMPVFGLSRTIFGAQRGVEISAKNGKVTTIKITQISPSNDQIGDYVRTLGEKYEMVSPTSAEIEEYNKSTSRSCLGWADASRHVTLRVSQSGRVRLLELQYAEPQESIVVIQMCGPHSLADMSEKKTTL